MPVKYFLVGKQVDKSVKKLPLRIHKKIDDAFIVLKQNPLAGEKLRGELAGYLKYKVGDYRIVYSFDTKESRVIVVKIEHRQGVYK